MSDAALALASPLSPEDRRRADIGARTVLLANDRSSLQLSVEGMHCANCMQTVERTLTALDPSVSARVNLSAHRLALSWATGAIEPLAAIEAVEAQGFVLRLFSSETADAVVDAHSRQLMRAMAVAGFAAANVMLLSIAIWASDGEMGQATFTLFHWLSALIALPAIAYAGRPFYWSAFNALKSRRLNMDVPISIAVILAAGLSLFETITGGEHAFFDAAVTLLFFLLIGRYLDDRARARAGSAAADLLATMGGTATCLLPDGTQEAVAVNEITQGMMIITAPGERVATDGIIRSGKSELDTSLVTGETLPESCEPGNDVFGGTLNLTSPLVIEVTAAAEQSLLAEIVELIETAEQSKARFVALAERAVQLYAPVVHLAALLTFAGWILFVGVPWQDALYTAIAVLIITCPCAIGLAVPVVQVIASGRLYRAGILLKSGDALERIAEVDTVLFDKTGTLTLGRPVLSGPVDQDVLKIAASIAAGSIHPLSKALTAACPSQRPIADIIEVPGEGLLAQVQGQETRLGNRSFCGVSEDIPAAPGPELWLSRPGHSPVQFVFKDEVRVDAKATIAELKARGLSIVLISGDRKKTTEAFAAGVGIENWHGEVRPAGKSAMVDQLTRAGHKVLMVGDGLNDAPALASAHASISPSTASDIAQTAADIIFQGRELQSVVEIIDVARHAKRRMLENFGIAALYNAFAIPAAVMGLVTPLIAALSMSASSLVVIANALRLRQGR